MSIEFGIDDPIAGRKLHEWKNMAGSRAQAGTGAQGIVRLDVVRKSIPRTPKSGLTPLMSRFCK
jgi:hypothetical protein